jgi:uncharacterized protein YjbJ (UPF0337 family)
VRAPGVLPGAFAVPGPKPRKEPEMGENIDEAKGRAKEAAGDLTDNKDLKREGKIDQATSDVKDKVGDAADKVKETVTSDDE